MERLMWNGRIVPRAGAVGVKWSDKSSVHVTALSVDKVEVVP